MSTTQGPTWQTVATVAVSVLVSLAVGVGGYFIAQQATRDTRQDQLLDSVSTKLVDISINMVKLSAAQQEMKETIAKEAAIRENRDRHELEELRRMNGKK